MILLTRASSLALAQAARAQEALCRAGYSTEIATCWTEGDRDQHRALARFGGSGAFCKAIEEALLAGRGDAAVHSLKDLPSRCPRGLRLAGVLSRDASGDVLVSRDGATLATLPERALIGTSSIRRRAQLLRARPDLQITHIRGNVPTRLQKLAEGRYDGIVLARAGLDRLGCAPEHCLALPFLPAPCQGIIALETLEGGEAEHAAATVTHSPSWYAALAERRLLQRLQVGCHVPFAALGVCEEGAMTLQAEILHSEGREHYRYATSGSVDSDDDALRLGDVLAERFLENGDAMTLIREARQ
ncbi:MAG: hydroxymethylbilane synthase [Synergistales bacterium]|nr:hydroxymethylbilane synthase [Synergistales bacterium]